MPVFGVGKVHRIWTPKGGPPQYLAKRMSDLMVVSVPFDLTKHEDQQTMLQWIKHLAIKGVLLAPPCGTASAAREIKTPGMNHPKPLRTYEEPEWSGFGQGECSKHVVQLFCGGA